MKSSNARNFEADSACGRACFDHIVADTVYMSLLRSLIVLNKISCNSIFASNAQLPIDGSPRRGGSPGASAEQL